MKRTTEFTLGLIGGIFGILFAFAALFMGVIDSALNASGTSSLTGLGWGAVIMSIIGIIGSVIVKSKAKLGGALMLIAAIGGFICISMFYIISGVLLLIAGIMGLVRKDKSKSMSA
ncbi:hypothetical protein BEH_07535 [Priestia filamentosa]|uniref:DUF4064 domain-containing protein n=1 Tax=Priestia filamentosa TaxID=1402861 RepID=A0A0H4KCW9_9BACI|nr:DUF4064 domain-containing protein [Priestia filamentosa]AKO91962.1 hypothetical protein BEH_07535 [Priestia filamentosa]